MAMLNYSGLFPDRENLMNAKLDPEGLKMQIKKAFHVGMPF
jgi:hypothetical protein